MSGHKVIVYLKGGGVVKLRDVEDFTVNANRVTWKMKPNARWKLLTLDPDEIAAVEYK